MYYSEKCYSLYIIKAVDEKIQQAEACRAARQNFFFFYGVSNSKPKGKMAYALWRVAAICRGRAVVSGVLLPTPAVRRRRKDFS